MGIFASPILLNLATAIATIAAVIYAYYKWSFQYWKRKNFPYLEPSIPLGNLPNPLSSPLSPDENALLMYKEAKGKGWRHCGAYLGTIPAYLVLDLELIKRILTKDFSYFMDRGMYVNEKDDILSANLFGLGGNKWKNLRTKLSPTFSSGKIKNMFQIMVDCGSILESYIEENFTHKAVVEIKEVLCRFTTDVIGSAAFGLNCNSFKEPNSPFTVYGRKVFENSNTDLLKFMIALNYPNAARSLGMRLFKKDITDFYSSVVKDTIAYRDKNNVSRSDFLQLLMEKRSKDDNNETGDTLTMNEIIAQSFLFFIGGFETSSTAMALVLFELSRHPEIQDKVRKEIREVLERHDNKITYESMNEMVYMQQILDETLRLYPPLSLITRECVEDYKVPGEDLVIEKGTAVFIPVIGIHYDEDYYENPNVFDPERFNAENRKSRDPFTHLPFGGGQRICIGERFGRLQMKVGLTSVLRNFKLSLNEKTKVPLKFVPTAGVTTPLGGVWLNVEQA